MGGGAIQDENGVWIGTADNNYANDTSGDDVYNLGGNNDEIVFDISGDKTIGNNRVILSQGENVSLYFTGDTSTCRFETSKSGNKDICVTIFKNTVEIGTITIEDPFRANFAQGLTIRSENGYLRNDFFARTIDKSKAKKGQTINGSFYNEYIKGSDKADKIYTGAGKDYIESNKGNDTIVINGKGIKTIEFGKNHGSNTIKFQGEGTDSTVNLDFVNDSWNEYRKIGKNLYIDNYSYDNYKKMGTQTLVDYFNLNDTLDSNFNNINMYISAYTDYEGTLKDKFTTDTIHVYGDKKRNVIGTHYNDYLHGSKKADKIITGIGNDKIKGGKGNDKIYLSSTGDKEIIINNGDGNDTIYCNEFTQNFNFIINGADAITYKKDNDDVIIYYTYTNGKKISTGTTTVKDYYTYTDTNISINDIALTSYDIENSKTRVKMSRNYEISDTANYAEKYI